MYKSKNCGHGFDLYLQTHVHTRSLLAPLTEKELILDKLADKTGLIYVPYIPVYCPICGKKVECGDKE